MAGQTINDPEAPSDMRRAAEQFLWAIDEGAHQELGRKILASFDDLHRFSDNDDDEKVRDGWLDESTKIEQLMAETRLPGIAVLHALLALEQRKW